MSRKPTAIITTPINPELAADQALQELIISSYAELRQIRRRRDSTLEHLRKDAEYLAARYLEIAERAVDGVNPSMLDGSFYAGPTERLATNTQEYRDQSERLEGQRYLLGRLLACTTATVHPEIVEAAQ